MLDMEAKGEELDLARAAFIHAHGRLQVALGRRDIWAWYAALGETLWWIVALDEHYRDAGKTVYESHRDGNAHGSVLPGLRFARNKVGHQLTLLVTDPCGGSVFHSADADGVRLDQLLWRESAQFPSAGDPQHPQRLCYDRLLANNAVRYAIRHANYFFVRHRARLDDALAVRPDEDPLLRRDKG
jgi:hypothetical protein